MRKESVENEIEAEVYATGNYVSVVKHEGKIIYIPRTDRDRVRVKILKEIVENEYVGRVVG